MAGWEKAAIIAGVTVLAACWPREASADPCEAPLPTQAGAEFSGVVRYIVDGDGLCIGPADGDGSTWIEVRLMDFNAPELSGPGGAAARSALERLTMGQRAQCVVTPGRRGTTRSYDRTHAVCRIGGQTIGDAMRSAGIAEGGN